MRPYALRMGLLIQCDWCLCKQRRRDTRDIYVYICIHIYIYMYMYIYIGKASCNDRGKDERLVSASQGTPRIASNIGAKKNANNRFSPRDFRESTALPKS